MGGRPLTALNVMGIPEDKVPPEVIAQILRGGASTAKKAGCALLGGHTIRNPEPVYGMAVTGIVHPKRMLTNASARPGDLLILTKPLGTGIATTAIKRGLASAQLARRAIMIMRQLNTAGAELAEKGLVRGATDVTGFGLLGHLTSMCRASGVGAELVTAAVPALSDEVFDLIAKGCIPGGTRNNLEAARDIVTWHDLSVAPAILLADAQTSGGLLLCVHPKRLDAVRAILKKHRTPASVVIGRITRSRNCSIIVS
ncbi:MAG: selD-2 [Phycisphaerales bacterium]|nr:selD-2 [Phycisphaerales bacterium]